MKKTFKKGLAAMLMAALMLLALSGCQVSSSSSSTTTVSTSVTDENGNTTTNTTTTETGVTAGSDGINTTSSTTRETTTTPADDGAQAEPADGQSDPDAVKDFTDRLYATYNMGAEGTTAAGDMIYYAFSDKSDDAIIILISADDQNYEGREGTLKTEDDHMALVSDTMNDETTFKLSETDDQGNFTMTFLGDGEEVPMHMVDQDTILKDIVARAQEFNLL